MATPAGILGCFPAILNTVGTQHATPNPTNINPIVETTIFGNKTEDIIPININDPLTINTF